MGVGSSGPGWSLQGGQDSEEESRCRLSPSVEMTQRRTEAQQQELLSEQEMIMGRDESQSVLYSVVIMLATIF